MSVTSEKIHPNGPVLSTLIWGAWRVLDRPETASAKGLLAFVERCVDLGVTTVDHADIYGGYRVEAHFGEAMALHPGLRQRLQLVTKCGIALIDPARPDHRVKHYNTTAAHIVASAEQSLINLRTDVIDLLLVHRPDPLMNADETARGLETLLTQGKVAHIGVSNFTPSQFDLLQSRLTTPLVTNQVEISPFMTQPLVDGSLDHAQRHRVRPMVWSPLGGGRLFDHGDDITRRVLACMAAMEDKYGTTDPATLALAWILRLPCRPLPLIGTSNPDRLEQQVRAVDIRMEDQDWFLLLEAATGREVA